MLSQLCQLLNGASETQTLGEMKSACNKLIINTVRVCNLLQGSRSVSYLAQ